MKKYLNQNEKDFWIITLLTTIHIDDTVTINKNLNKEEVKKLKAASTYMKNAYKSVASRIDKQSEKQILKYMSQNEIKVISKARNRIEEKKLEEKMLVNTSTLEKITSFVCSENCGNCKEDSSKCDIYFILDDFRMDGFNLFDNCPYSFIDKEKASTPPKTKEKSKRYMKKHKNRYDEDTEDFEYNFKVKDVRGR